MKRASAVLIVIQMITPTRNNPLVVNKMKKKTTYDDYFMDVESVQTQGIASELY